MNENPTSRGLSFSSYSSSIQNGKKEGEVLKFVVLLFPEGKWETFKSQVVWALATVNGKVYELLMEKFTVW